MKHSHDILVIDDESVVLQGIQRICASEGFAILTASSAREGLSQLEKSSVRLIICDIMMEGMDGFEFLAELRKRAPAPPVVMTTGYSTVENAVRSLHCGAIDYLPKPFTADELLAVVYRALNFGSLPTSAPALPKGAPDSESQVHCLGQVSWAKTESSGTVLIGMNESFLITLKGLRCVELLPKGTALIQGSCCATIVSSDGLSHGLLCPVSGEIIETHLEVATQPALIENDPYGAGWLYRILPSDLEHGFAYLTPLSTIREQLNEYRKRELP